MAIRVERKQVTSPTCTKDVVLILAEAITKFSLTETPYVLKLPSAILHAVFDQGKQSITRECSERNDCVQLKASEVLMEELCEIKKLLTWTKNIKSIRKFKGFLKVDRIEKQVEVLKWKSTARIMKPCYRVICDRKSKCLILFIRGTHSVPDTLTDLLCAPVSFQHWVYSDDGKRKTKVSGHVHRGILAAAEWIKEGCISTLHDGLKQHPHYKIKVVGHSLGGGTAALLTYMLREIQQFSSTTCVTFGPAACVTMELAEFGKPFITSIINGFDIVPTLSASSAHDFLSQGQIVNENIRTAVGSFLPKFAKKMAKHTLTLGTKVVYSLVEVVETSFSRHNLNDYEDDDEYNSFSEESDDDDDLDDNEDDDKLLNGNIDAKEKEANNISKEEILRYHLYPPGRIMHIFLENFNPLINDANEKCVWLYETPRDLYGKLRFSRRMILDHRTKKYLENLQQVIDQLKKEQFKHREE